MAMGDTLSDEDVVNVINELAAMVRDRWDKLGYLEAEGGAFATGHVPAVAPQAYLCRFYAGLTDAGLNDAEAESERYLPKQYRDFLRSFNGARIMGISLNGSTGGQNLREIGGVGQPISIRYQNVWYTRPEYIPEGHFGLGAINGPWYSQGHLYLTSTGEVELINRDHDLIGKTWSSFAEFLRQEVPRQLSRHDEAGLEIEGIKCLPGNTDGWEYAADRLGSSKGKLLKLLGCKDAQVLQRPLRTISPDPVAHGGRPR